MDTTIIDIEIVPVVEARLSRLIHWLKSRTDERYTQADHHGLRAEAARAFILRAVRIRYLVITRRLLTPRHFTGAFFFEIR